MEKKVKLATAATNAVVSMADKVELALATKNSSEAYREIMPLLWSRLSEFSSKWQVVYKCLSLLDAIIKHGSHRAAEEARERSYPLSQLKNYQASDENGADRGAGIRELAENLLTMINDQDELRKAREAAEKIRSRIYSSSSGQTGIGSNYKTQGIGNNNFNTKGRGTRSSNSNSVQIRAERKKRAQEAEKNRRRELEEELERARAEDRDKKKKKKDKKNKRATSVIDDDDDFDFSMISSRGTTDVKKASGEISLDEAFGNFTATPVSTNINVKTATIPTTTANGDDDDFDFDPRSGSTNNIINQPPADEDFGEFSSSVAIPDVVTSNKNLDIFGAFSATPSNSINQNNNQNLDFGSFSSGPTNNTSNNNNNFTNNTNQSNGLDNIFMSGNSNLSQNNNNNNRGSVSGRTGKIVLTGKAKPEKKTVNKTTGDVWATGLVNLELKKKPANNNNNNNNMLAPNNFNMNSTGIGNMNNGLNLGMGNMNNMNMMMGNRNNNNNNMLASGNFNMNTNMMGNNNFNMNLANNNNNNNNIGSFF